MEKGYIQIYTGDGKGKTTAAIGLSIRAAGAGLSVFMAQFLKKSKYSEIKGLERFSDRIAIEQFGTGKYVRGEPAPEDIAAAKKGFSAARSALLSGKYDMVILDEICVALFFKVLSEDAVLGLMDEKPDGVELVLTGRKCPDAIMDRADLVTEMRAVKHYYDEGVLARIGIEN
ncbi:MAG: cob(I)yrinic acid a,c-diamide adenosyltransferase [Deltaproteobacteria bacterium]|nr:cob(I)yrinic acid a,c-diamide adenosyltransferase [Deltaproteobacteria bacterium]